MMVLVKEDACRPAYRQTAYPAETGPPANGYDDRGLTG